MSWWRLYGDSAEGFLLAAQAMQQRQHHCGACGCAPCQCIFEGRGAYYGEGLAVGPDLEDPQTLAPSAFAQLLGLEAGGGEVFGGYSALAAAGGWSQGLEPAPMMGNAEAFALYAGSQGSSVPVSLTSGLIYEAPAQTEGIWPIPWGWQMPDY